MLVIQDYGLFCKTFWKIGLPKVSLPTLMTLDLQQAWFGYTCWIYISCDLLLQCRIYLLPCLRFAFFFPFKSECDDRCYHHGECQGNGSCHCLPGWNGKFCTISGCPNNCFDRGLCKLADKQSYSLDRDQPSVVAHGQKIWKCFCHIGFTGDDCTTPTETECQDNEDNDNGEKYFFMHSAWRKL